MEKAGGDKNALAEAEEWGRSRERRLPVLRRFVALLARNGIIGQEADRVERDFVVAQCYAIATGHGLNMMEYRYRDSQSGPLAPLLDVDLNAVEIDTTGGHGRVSPGFDEAAFLAGVAGKDYAELGRMARDAVISDRERLYMG